MAGLTGRYTALLATANLMMFVMAAGQCHLPKGLGTTSGTVTCAGAHEICWVTMRMTIMMRVRTWMDGWMDGWMHGDDEDDNDDGDGDGDGDVMVMMNALHVDDLTLMSCACR